MSGDCSSEDCRSRGIRWVSSHFVKVFTNAKGALCYKFNITVCSNTCLHMLAQVPRIRPIVVKVVYRNQRK